MIDLEDAIHIVECHAEGEVGDVIIGGVAPPSGASIWEKSRFIAEDKTLRSFVLNEPRGGVFRHINLLVPPISKEADMGFIIMEPEDTPPMSGSNSICVATVLLEAGILPMSEPETVLHLEALLALLKCAHGAATAKWSIARFKMSHPLWTALMHRWKWKGMAHCLSILLMVAIVLWWLMRKRSAFLLSQMKHVIWQN